jgi:hypothetical protein
MQRIAFNGRFWWEHLDPYGGIIAWGSIENGLTDAALDDALEVLFRNGTQNANWYAGIIRDDNFTGLADADTMASHAGWEEGDEYDEATRPAWTPPAASDARLVNDAAIEFTINAKQTFKGFFITSDNTIRGTTGILWSTGVFDADQAMNVGEVLKVFYDLSSREG